MAGRYSKLHSNYILKKHHQYVKGGGRILERDWVTIGGQHQIEKGKKPYYADTNFLFTDNSYPSYKKRHNYGKWVAHWDYDDVKNSEPDVNNVVVNNTSNDIRDFAYYGSAVELVRSSVLNIINWFPARVTISPDEIYAPNSTGGYDVVSGYYLLNNPFNIDFIHELSNNEKKIYNEDRFLLNSYKNYTIGSADITDYETINRQFMTKQLTIYITFIHVDEDGEEIESYTTPYTCEFWQMFEDSQIETAQNKGWTATKFCGLTWLPNMILEKDYYGDEDFEISYIDENDRTKQLSAKAQTVIKSYQSSKDGITANKNFPLYTVKINGEDKIEGYVINAETVQMTNDGSLLIRAKQEAFDEYFSNLDGFEKQLLTLTSKPLYKNSFLTAIEGELTYKYVYRDYTWPSTYDEELGYGHIDITSQSYVSYVQKLIDMATVFDELWCDNLYRNMTHESIKNFDWTYTREYTEGDEQDNIDGGNRVMQLLRIYGRAFDDLKRLADGIGFVTSNTYDGFSNQPDAEISDRLDMAGWDIVSTIPVIKDTNQGYISTSTSAVISKKTYDTLEDKSDYSLAYINDETATIISDSDYTNITDGDEKKKFSKYYPAMDLSDVIIDANFVDSISKKDGSKHEKWFNSSNSGYFTTATSDIEFMRRLMLSTGRIFRTKGTKHAIDMVMGMFGFGENDYELSEKYYYTVPKSYDENVDLVENINYYKNYQKNYEDIYSGVPLNDIFVGNEHFIVPYYTQTRRYDGELIFESKGGWGKKDNGDYTETLSYLHVVGEFGELLDVNPNSLSGDDIYYVVSLSSYTEYKDGKPKSHFFYLKPNGEYNPQLPENWGDIDMDGSSDEAKRARYLDSIISTNVGNNPHVGFGNYDDGKEYKEYMQQPFKYAVDEYLLPEEWMGKAQDFLFTVTDVEDNDKVKVLLDNDTSKYYLNRKWFQIENKLNNALYKDYFKNVILNYVMQVIPSTTILILKNFD